MARLAEMTEGYAVELHACVLMNNGYDVSVEPRGDSLFRARILKKI